jgi:hypothetical protein
MGIAAPRGGMPPADLLRGTSIFVEDDNNKQMRISKKGDKDKGHNHCKSNGTTKDSGHGVEIVRNHTRGARSEGNNTNNDGGLSDFLSFNFEEKLHSPKDKTGEGDEAELEREQGWNPGTGSTA